MDFLKSFKTRWNKIAPETSGFRLACSHPMCSLSCANLRNGKLSVTSVHGVDRHSYAFTKNDMAFTTLMFLESLSEKELSLLIKIFNKISPDFVLNLEELKDE